MEGRGLKGLARSLRPKVSDYGLNHKQVPHFDLLKIHSQEFTPNRENEYMPLFIVVFFFSIEVTWFIYCVKSGSSFKGELKYSCFNIVIV